MRQQASKGQSRLQSGVHRAHGLEAAEATLEGTRVVVPRDSWSCIGAQDAPVTRYASKFPRAMKSNAMAAVEAAPGTADVTRPVPGGPFDWLPSGPVSSARTTTAEGMDMGWRWSHHRSKWRSLAR